MPKIMVVYGTRPEAIKLVTVIRALSATPGVEVVRKSERFREPTVACLGLSYKANVDDLRESPAIDIVAAIARSRPDLDIRVAEPLTHMLPHQLADLPNVRLEGASDAIAAADIVVLLVDHDHFKALSRSRLAGKVVYDTRGLWR